MLNIGVQVSPAETVQRAILSEPSVAFGQEREPLTFLFSAVKEGVRCRMTELIVSGMDKYKPAVSRDLLLFLAGIAWVCVGIMLLCFAFSWLSASSGTNIYGVAAAGAVIALCIHHFGFLKIVDKNLNRILLMKEKNCLFAFIPWKSYLIIGGMITMGYELRHSTIPKQYLAILYIGIGLALILSSFRYLRIFIREIRR